MKGKSALKKNQKRIILALDPGQRHPATPGNMEWGSTAHRASFHGVRMGRRGEALISSQGNALAHYFDISYHLSPGTSSEALITAMAISMALTRPLVKDAGGDEVLAALLSDLTAYESKDRERIILEMYREALAHHKTSGILGCVTALSFLVGMERVGRKDSTALPHLASAMDEVVQRGEEERQHQHPIPAMLLGDNAHPLASFLSEELNSGEHRIYYSDFPIDPLASEELMGTFSERYWRELNNAYLIHLRQTLQRTGQLFDEVSSLLWKNYPSNLWEALGALSKDQVEVLSVWGVNLESTLNEFVAISQEASILHSIASAMEDQEAFLGENARHVNRGSLGRLAALAMEYNVEWAIAAYDWGAKSRAMSSKQGNRKSQG